MGSHPAAMPEVRPTAAAFLPQKHDLRSLREAASHCQGCPLFANATQTVFGAGPAHARLMMVGEQPGDVEDRAGEPFVGPAGRLLDQMLEEAGIPRQKVYVTNAVKHFKWTARGKRRLHGKPNSREIFACRAWLEAELEAIKPELEAHATTGGARSLLALVRPRATLRGGNHVHGDDGSAQRISRGPTVRSEMSENQCFSVRAVGFSGGWRRADGHWPVAAIARGSAARRRWSGPGISRLDGALQCVSIARRFHG
jgi:DNA polymerase